MPRTIFLAIFLLVSGNFAYASEPISLAISTPDETAPVFLELFSKRFDVAKEDHPEISEISNETIPNFVLVQSSKGTLQKEDTNLCLLLREIVATQSTEKTLVASVKEVALAWAKEKYSACTVNGIVYRYEEKSSLDRVKCSFDKELDEALSETRVRNVFAKIKNPDGINLKELVDAWKQIESELGGIDYNFILPLVYDKEPSFEEINEIISSDSYFVSSGRKAVNQFFLEISVLYDGSPFDFIIQTLKGPGIKNAYYFVAVQEEPSTTITHSLLILDEHNQVYGLEIGVSRVN